MATYVLVHGAGHGGWCFQRLAPLLRREGHAVYTPTLTGLGERAHLLAAETCLSTHIADVASLIEFEDLSEVILVGHSYGGMVITGTADRMLARVARLVFLDAAIPASGENLLDVLPGSESFLRPGLRKVDGIELTLWPDSESARKLYGVHDDADWAWMQPRLRPHPWRCFTERLVLEHPAEVARLPRSILNCQATMKGRAGMADLSRFMAGEHVWERNVAHDMMITAPEMTAELLLGLA